MGLRCRACDSTLGVAALIAPFPSDVVGVSGAGITEPDLAVDRLIGNGHRIGRRGDGLNRRPHVVDRQRKGDLAGNLPVIGRNRNRLIFCWTIACGEAPGQCSITIVGYGAD